MTEAESLAKSSLPQSETKQRPEKVTDIVGEPPEKVKDNAIKIVKEMKMDPLIIALLLAWEERPSFLNMPDYLPHVLALLNLSEINGEPVSEKLKALTLKGAAEKLAEYKKSLLKQEFDSRQQEKERLKNEIEKAKEQAKQLEELAIRLPPTLQLPPSILQLISN